MPLMHCPHCGARNFTMEGWEDLDHCASCGKPLGEPIADPAEPARQASRPGRVGGARHRGSEGEGAPKPRRA